jgi:hypothetical protein
MPRGIKPVLVALAAGVAGLALSLPALGQEAPESLLPPGFGSPPPRATPAAPPPAASAPAAPVAPAAPGGPAATPPVPAAPAGADAGVAVSDGALQSLDALVNAITSRGEELPSAAKRSLALVGTAPIYGTNAFGDADGRYLVTLMRRVQTPLASRWAEITLRRMLVQATPAPRGEGEADWVADRSALCCVWAKPMPPGCSSRVSTSPISRHGCGESRSEPHLPPPIRPGCARCPTVRSRSAGKPSGR